MNVKYLPELSRILRNGFGSLRNGDGIGFEQNVFELAFVAIEADVLAAVAEGCRRPGPVLVACRFGEEISALHFHSRDHLFGDSVVFHLKKSELFACFGDQLTQLGSLQAEIYHWDSHGPSFLGPQRRRRWHHHFQRERREREERERVGLFEVGRGKIILKG